MDGILSNMPRTRKKPLPDGLFRLDSRTFTLAWKSAQELWAIERFVERLRHSMRIDDISRDKPGYKRQFLFSVTSNKEST